MAAESANVENTFDVVIVGAGISGINCAYRLRTRLPNVTFTLLEGRADVGGTWDQFTYPGVRSDSPMYTLGFGWHPWSLDCPIAEGSDIIHYIKDAISKHHLQEHIRFHHNVSSIHWSSATQRWTVDATSEEQQETFTARWVVQGTGYFDYHTPLQANIPGLNRFKGDVLNPQFWPKGYDYRGKRIALIGSGATAITLLPHLAKKAAQVVMIQRSPTYVVASRNTSWAHKYLPLPLWLIRAYRRFHHTVFSYIFVLICKYFPGVARETLRKQALRSLPPSIKQETHFNPVYNPWEQRICLDPDGIFYKSLGRHNVKLITSKIQTVTDTGVTVVNTGAADPDSKTEAGETVDADVIVTATGFVMKMGGNIDIYVDGEQKTWKKRLIWNGAMLNGIPNMMFMFGYTNNAWTLGADDTAIVLVRLWKYMTRNGKNSVVPHYTEEGEAGTERMWQLSSSYAKTAEDRLPVYGKTGNWRPRTRPPFDYIHARWGNYTDGLEFLS